jgi:hypothetical protein
MEAFSMFDSVGNALDELQSLRKKKTESIDKHIAKFKMLAAESKIDTTNPLTIELFKEMLPWGLDTLADKTRNTTQDHCWLVQVGGRIRS